MDTAGSVLVVAPKLVAPSLSPQAIVRERVVRLLDEAVQRPLTVLSAPAGYGKTTAVVQWLERSGLEHAWLTLDADDNDPRRLSAHLLAAVGLHGRRYPLESVVPVVVNTLAEREPCVIVLDDYHVIEQPACHDLMVALLDALPPAGRVVVCSRTPPPLRLGRRRASATVAELGWRELRFQDAEAESLGVEPRMEGWPAGLAAKSRVAAYLHEQVLDRTEPRLREFLLRTSILRRLSGPLCEAVLDDSDAHELLEEVRRSNLFVITLDGDDRWLRYHRPFAELLERELGAASPQLVPVLHRRASAWFAGNGLLEEAIRHASAAGDGERAAELLLAGWRELLLLRPAAELRRLIAQLPADRGELRAFCEALDAMCMSLEGVEPRLVRERVEALSALRELPGVAQIIDPLRVSPLYGDVGRAVEDGWWAWGRYPELQARALLAGPFGAVLWFAGDRDAARDVVEPLIGVVGPAAGRTFALATLALTAADDGDGEVAERHARDAVEAAEADGDVAAVARHVAHVALAEALRVRGTPDEAGKQLAVAARLIGDTHGSVSHALTLVFEAQLALARHDRSRARARAAAARATVERYPDVGILAGRLTRVEEALKHRRSDDLAGSEPTAAERRVLALLPSDLTMEQIAAELYLSAHTVKSHRRRLYRRLGVSSREEAVTAARERGLL